MRRIRRGNLINPSLLDGPTGATQTAPTRDPTPAKGPGLHHPTLVVPIAQALACTPVRRPEADGTNKAGGRAQTQEFLQTKTEGMEMKMIARNTTLTLIATAAVITMTGCGGGEDNVRPDNITSTGMEIVTPPPTPVNGTGAQLQRTNPNAVDIGDDWQAPEALLGALGATDTAAGTSRLSTALAAADDPSPSASSIRSIDAADMTPIGARGDITVGRWTSGPADTFDIDFYFHPDADLTAADRARIERAGKAWSRYIGTDLDAQTIAAGTTINRGSPSTPTSIEETVNVDDMLIVVTTRTQGRSSLGGSSFSLVGDTFIRRIGYLDINTAHGHQRKSDTIVHEVGHALYHTPVTIEGAITSTVERYLSADMHHFEGPAAMQANGGMPVPFQWVNSDNRRVDPGTPSAVIDYGHNDVCTSIMSYCRESDVETPSALDIAWLKDMGHEINDPATALDAEVYGYGAWGTYSAWGAGVARHLTGFEANDDRLEATADAFGVLPDSTLAESVAAQTLTGSATWRGVLLGVDIATDAFSPVSGNATLNVDLDSLDGTAAFDNLMAHEDGHTSAFRTSHLEYSITVDGNRFEDANQRIDGGFYGPNHNEMAGVLNDNRSTVNLMAGFGGTKDD